MLVNLVAIYMLISNLVDIITLLRRQYPLHSVGPHFPFKHVLDAVLILTGYRPLFVAYVQWRTVREKLLQFAVQNSNIFLL
jgi:hypothetical protein